MKIQKFSPDGTCILDIDDRSLIETKAERINIMKMFCSQTIAEAGLDQITQTNAVARIYPLDRCEAIKHYISACRNEYLRCKALILSAKTNDEADAVKFTAPIKPETL